MVHIFKKYLWSGIGILFLLLLITSSFKLPITIFSVVTVLFIISLVPVAIYDKHQQNKIDKKLVDIINAEHKKIDKD